MTLRAPYTANTVISSADVSADLQGLADGTNFTYQTGWIIVTDSWTYASATSPEFTITVPTDGTTKYQAGMRIKLTQSSTVKYFIITKVAATVLTVYGGTDYTLTNSAISTISYSMQKSPFGFVNDPAKWTVTTSLATGEPGKASPVSGTWYGDTGLSPTGPNISIPTGVWDVSYHATIYGQKNTATAINVWVALSTSASSVSDQDFVAHAEIDAGSSALSLVSPVARHKHLSLTATTTYYLILKTTVSSQATIATLADLDTVFIRAICAYL